MGNEYQMRRRLKIESYDRNLQREGMPQRKQRWNGHVLTTQERAVRRQRWKGCNPLRLSAFMDMWMESSSYVGKEMTLTTLMRACLVELINRNQQISE